MLEYMELVILLMKLPTTASISKVFIFCFSNLVVVRIILVKCFVCILVSACLHMFAIVELLLIIICCSLIFFVSEINNFV